MLSIFVKRKESSLKFVPLTIFRKHFSSYNKAVPSNVLKMLKSHQKSLLLVYAAAVGFSACVLYKRKINCFTDESAPVETDEREIILNREEKKYDKAINKSRDVLIRMKDEVGAPGVSIGVSVDGKTVWTEGLGYADIENRVACSADTVMRVASISKSITMAAVARLMEQGQLDLDKPVQEYVPTFPQKSFDGKPVIITLRHLVSHMAGIRHYEKSNNQNGSKNIKNNSDKKRDEKSEFDNKEYYIKEKHDVKSSMDLFKDDPLISKPGTKFHYTTHGFTLVSAIVEAVSKEEFSKYMKKMFKTLGMKNTYLDENDIIIYNRSRNYKRNKRGHLVNTPYVDNSYKWAGGGFLSTVTDLLQFANAMLYSFQLNDELTCKSLVKTDESDQNYKRNYQVLNQREELRPGFLKSKTMETIWTPVINTNEHAKYSMGWVTIPEKHNCEFCEKIKFCVYHTGGAIGASSILLILPKSSSNKLSAFDASIPPKGVVVTILTNLTSVNLTNTALKIAEIFDNL